MPIPMSDVKCAACENKLARVNTNPDGLCGDCQRVLKPKSERFRVWDAAGRPALAQMLKAKPLVAVSRRSNVAVLAERAIRSHLPDVTRLPVAYLMECVAEFQKRAKEAERVTALASRVFPKFNP